MHFRGAEEPEADPPAGPDGRGVLLMKQIPSQNSRVPDTGRDWGGGRGKPRQGPFLEQGSKHLGHATAGYQHRK